MSYWFTAHYPPVDKNNHGLWVYKNHKNKIGIISHDIKKDDLVFIYEVKSNQKKNRHDGSMAVKAVVKVSKLLKKTHLEPDDFIKIADTEWIAPLYCDSKTAAAVVNVKSLGKSYLNFGIDGSNIKSLDRHAAFKLFSTCTGDNQDELLQLYFPDEFEDISFQYDVEKANPEQYKSSPRKTEWIKIRGQSKVKVTAGIAKRRLVMAGYKCEIDKTHVSFTSDSTKHNYVEAHHLVPLAVQKEFGDISLDHEANIFSLCPNCHRLLHHAIMKEKEQILKEMHLTRAKQLEKASIKLTPNKLIAYYQRAV